MIKHNCNQSILINMCDVSRQSITFFSFLFFPSSKFNFFLRLISIQKHKVESIFCAHSIPITKLNLNTLSWTDSEEVLNFSKFVPCSFFTTFYQAWFCLKILLVYHNL